MNLASALIKQVLKCEDFDTWMNVRKHYLPSEYHSLFDIISKHSDNYHKLPQIEELKLEIRDSATLDKVYALDSIDIETEPFLLLDYLKNEFAQKEVLSQVDKWIDASIAFESAEEIVRSFQQIGVVLEDRVELTPDQENMQKINLFDSEEEMGNRITLGLNKEFDDEFNFRTTDYIMIGGKRGAGKSIVVSNVANNVVERLGKKALIFSIEMETREVLQRACSIASGVPFKHIRDKTLSLEEWDSVVKWWASRYEDSEVDVAAYNSHHDFSRFHSAISRKPLVSAFVDIVYDPNLTLGRIRAEVEKRKREGNLGLIGVDYINKVKRVANASAVNDFDWKEQIAISHAFKTIAQDAGVPLLSPYQIDASGEARFAKGILDSCDAALVLESFKEGITFTTTKMRGARDDAEFTSGVTWSNLRIGPDSVDKPEKEDKKKKGDTIVKAGVYDN